MFGARGIAGRRLSLLAAVVAVALGLAIDVSGLLDDAERRSVDSRFELRGEDRPGDDVVLVAIDDVTFSELKQRWPFPRPLHADAIRAVAADGPKAIVYDVQFTEATDPECGDDAADFSDPACRAAIRADNALVLAARRAGNVVFATTEVNPKGRSNVFGGARGQRFARADVGNARFDVDPGGVYRRGRFAVDGLKTLPVVAVQTATGRTLSADDLPEDPFWIDYAGPPGTIPRESFSRVVDGKVPEGRFHDRIVVIGPVAQVLQDVHPTSFANEGEMSGAEIQANAIATALAGFPMRGIPRWLGLLITALMAIAPLAAALVIARSPRFSGALSRSLGVLAATVAVAVTWIGIALLAFGQDLILPVAAPLTALLVSGVAALGVGYVNESFEREWTRRMFGRFVSDDVVTQVLEKAGREGDVRLGGERVLATILISDLRGFTSFSEQHPPEEVLGVLNRFLSRLSDAILDQGGTITGYAGDGIVAVFGAPLGNDDHADRAFEAAREMLRRAAELNREFADEALGVAFKMGIGLNSGPLMAGNIGSERRLEYTVIGDVVNAASRIEGATKGTPYQLFVSATTHQAFTRGHPELAFHGTIELRGKQSGVGVYALAEEFSAPTGSDVPESVSTA